MFGETHNPHPEKGTYREVSNHIGGEGASVSAEAIRARLEQMYLAGHLTREQLSEQLASERTRQIAHAAIMDAVSPEINS